MILIPKFGTSGRTIRIPDGLNMPETCINAVLAGRK